MISNRARQLRPRFKASAERLRAAIGQGPLNGKAGKQPRRGQDTAAFLRAWLANPLRVSAVAPSSPALAALITSEIAADVGPVLELGPGTGVFTRALLDRGVPEQNLTLVECDPQFAALLEARFPAAKVLRNDAARLPTAAAAYGAAVSGLPLLSMPNGTIMRIVRSAFRQMHAEAAFYQFTYGPACPVPRPILERLGLRAVRIGGTLRNLPPASVYRITRQPDQAVRSMN